MKKSWDIFRIDWRRISRSKAAILLVVALMILPSLYAWFNIKALWDPYGNTSGIKIAVANDDAGTTINDEQINVGEEIVQKLKENESLGWVFVNKKKADEGVKYGDYYASLYIPEDFSGNLSSVLTDNPEKAEIVFTVNDKINAITPKITATGATTITNQVREEFVGTVSEALLTAFNEIGIALKEDLPTIRNLEDKLYKLQATLPKITEFGQQVINLEGQLPTIQEKAEKIVDLPQYIPEIDKVGEGVLKIEEALPTLEEIGEKIVVLQEQIPQIKESAEKLGDFQQQFDSAAALLIDAISQANKAIEVIAAVQEQLPKIEQITTNSEEYVAVVEDFVTKVNGSFSTIADALKLNITIVNSTATSIVKVLETMQNQTDVPIQTTSQLQQLLTQQSALLGVQSSHVQALLNQEGSSTALQSLLQKTNTAQSQVNSLSSKLQSNSSIQDMYNQAVKIQQLTSNMLNNFDSTYLPAVQQMLTSLQTDLETAESVIQEAQKQLPNITELLTSTSEIITNAKTTLQTYENALPVLEEKVQIATKYINDNLDSVITGIDTAASFYSEHFAEVEAGIHKGSDFVQNDLPGLEAELQHAAQLVEEKMPAVMEAVQTASALAQSELPQLVKTINNAAGKLTEMKENITLEEVIDILRRDVQVDSDFLSDPIELKEEMLFPIANYGSASSPFYTSLAIWVGALLLVSMLSVDVEMPKEMYKPHHFYFGRGLTFLAIAIVQTIIVSVGDIFLLGVDVHDRIAFVLFSLIICFVFTTIVYTLVAIFGNIGKGGAIILLVLQISSSGGNFPIEVSSSFFQHLYPFLPFTYAVNLLREGLGGVIWQNASQYIAVLLFIAALFIVIGTVLKKPLMDAVEAFTENAKKSKIFH
ncbi:MAG: YhgE/Pip family protein [Bacillus sp. (in: firmicutes)]